MSDGPVDEDLFAFNREDSERIGRVVTRVEKEPRNRFTNPFQGDQESDDIFYVRLTAVGADLGFYDGEEVVQDGNGDWEALELGITWEVGEDNAGQILDGNKGSTAAIIGNVYQALLTYDEDGAGQWIFFPSLSTILPHQLSISGTTATVGAQRGAADYPFVDRISIGAQAVILKTVSEDVAAAVDGVVYYEIILSTFTATLKFAVTLPTATADKRFIPIGRIKGGKPFQIQHGYIRLDLGEIRVSDDDTTLRLLDDKIVTPTDLGDAAAVVPTNLMMVSWVGNGGADEVLNLDIDINRLLPVSTPSGSSVILFSTGVLGGAHDIVSFNSLAGDGLTFGTDFDVNVKNSIEIDADALQFVNDEAIPADGSPSVYSFTDAAKGWTGVIGDNIWTKADVNVGKIRVFHSGPDSTVDLAFKAFDSTLSDPGGTDTARINALYNNLIDVNTDRTGHFESVDGTTPSGSPDDSVDPADDPNSVGQYDAAIDVYNDAGSTLATDGQTVQEWHEQVSGGSNNLGQTTGSLKPIFRASVSSANNEPGVEFDGTDDFLQATAAVIPAGAKAVIMVVSNVDSGAGAYIDNHNTSTTLNGFSFFGGTTMRSISAKGAAPFRYDITTSATFDGTAPHMIIHTWDGTTTANQAINYVDVVTSSDSTGTALTTEGVAGSQNLAVGNDSGAPQGNPKGMTLHYLQFLDAVPSSTKLSQYRNFLSDRFGF